MPDKLSLSQFGQRIKAKHPEYNDLDDEVLAKKVLAKYPEYGDMVITPTMQGQSIQPQPSRFSAAGIKKLAYETADRATNALPAIGGIAGGAIGLEGGPLAAIGGAGIGGMGGEAARRITRGAIFPGEEASSVGDVANGISKQGIEQAIYEAGGQGLGRIGKAVAPKLAEAAVAPGKRLLKSIPEDVNIGKTILQDSTSIKPGKIAKELESKIVADRGAKLEAMSSAKQAGVKIPIAAPQDMTKLEVEKASAENTPEYLRGARDVRDQLHYQLGENGKPTPILDINGHPTGNFETLPDQVDPSRYDALRQGVDRTVGSFNPEAQGALDPLRKQIRGTMSRELHYHVPETAPLDERMTRMIPAKEAAWNTSFNPGITRNVVDKLARPTGALIGSVAGAKAGYDEGGIGGAITGGAIGAAAPALATSPTGLMIGARIADSQIPAKVLRYALPLVGSQIERSKNKQAGDGQNEEQR